MATPNHNDPATANNRNGSQAAIDSRGKSDELREFIGLTAFLAPALTAALVAILGFTIWISQMVLGPPGPQG